MNAQRIKLFVRTWMLPIAMLGGILLHNYMHWLSPISPYLIGVMLFLTYCKLNPREMRITPFSLVLLLIQILGAITIYILLIPFNEILAQGAFICVFCPTATAAPVITGMLGGSITRLASFSLLSNFTVALLAPFLFTLLGTSDVQSEVSFYNVLGMISIKVVPLIIGPLVLALILEAISPDIHDMIGRYQEVSFYVWAIALFIVVGNAVSYVISHLLRYPGEGGIMLQLAIASLVVCCAQFYFGRRVGKKFGDKVAGAQGLGQKNTVLAIWMALTFLHPITSIAPAAYVAWQNTINSLQIWNKNRTANKITAL